MVHDEARVEAIRARVTTQIALIQSLTARVVKGKLFALEVALNQTSDIETLFLQGLERQDRTPAEEARWLSFAEHMLQTWVPFLQEIQEQFSKYGEMGIEILGG